MKGRQFELLIHLLGVKQTTYKQLAERFEVSSKTVERDIDFLASMGVPVHCLQGKGGGVFIDQNYKLSKSFFTDQDIWHIVLALSVLDNITGKDFKKEIIQKLTLIAPELTVLFERDARNYFTVDLMSSPIVMQTEFTNAINQALDEEVLLSIQVGGVAKQIAPISYVLKSNGMHLYCFSNAYELIDLNQIEQCFVTDIDFTREFEPYENLVTDKNAAAE